MIKANIVYKVVLQNRERQGLKPFSYIGLKTNCWIRQSGNSTISIYPRKRSYQEYLGSSRSNSYWKDLEVCGNDYRVEWIASAEDFNDLCDIESLEILKHDWEELYNICSVTTSGTYQNPNYGVFISDNDKTPRKMLLNDERILSGEYYGITKGIPMKLETKQKLSDIFSVNPSFKGMTHSKESKEKISLAFQERLKDEGWRAWYSQLRSDIARNTFLGKPKTSQHKNSISESNRKVWSGYQLLKNVKTGEIVRIPHEERDLYDSNVWMNPYTASLATGGVELKTCEHCGLNDITPTNYNRWHGENCSYVKERKSRPWDHHNVTEQLLKAYSISPFIQKERCDIINSYPGISKKAESMEIMKRVERTYPGKCSSENIKRVIKFVRSIDYNIENDESWNLVFNQPQGDQNE